MHGALRPAGRYTFRFVTGNCKGETAGRQTAPNRMASRTRHREEFENAGVIFGAEMT
jgi:hypothetical protein